MNPAEQQAKLRTIAQLDAEQLQGWREMLPLMADRPFPGEAEALIQRERQLAKRRAA